MKVARNINHDYWKQFRSPEEKTHDEKWEAHLDFLCDDDCKFCKAAAEVAAEESKGG